MENNKITQDFLLQLKRIADALEKKNTLELTREKRMIKLEKLEERKLRSDLRSNLNTNNESLCSDVTSTEFHFTRALI